MRRNPGDLLLFRGTQTADPGKTVLSSMSFTPVLTIATIYSSHPGDVWSRMPPHFLTASTVHAVTLKDPRIFDLRGLGPSTLLSYVLRGIGYPKNISEDEVLRIYNYLHNRIIGRAKGGAFRYKVFDEDGEELGDDDVPLSFSRPESLISWQARPDFEAEPTLVMASLLMADTFAFIDAPAVQRAIKRMGYDVIAHVDVFGYDSAAETLLGLDEEAMSEVEGISVEMDELVETDELDEDEYDIFVHDTYRVLNPKVVVKADSFPVTEALELLELGGISGSQRP